MTELASVEVGRPWLRRAISAARWIFGPAALVFLLVAGYSARDTFMAVVSQAAWTGLAAAVVIWATLHLLSPIFTVIVLRSFGARVQYRDALGIHVRRLPAKYLPGGIWHTVSRVMDLHQLGVSRRHLAALVVLENVLPVALALVLGGGFLLLSGQETLIAQTCIGIGLVLLGLAPFLLKHASLLGAGYRFDRALLAAAAITTLFWLIAATAFATYWTSFPDTQSHAGLANIYAAYLLGWACGFIAIFAPQGLGVFESVASLLLRGMLPFAGIAVLVAGFRVAILIADAGAYVTYAGLRHARRPA